MESLKIEEAGTGKCQLLGLGAPLGVDPMGALSSDASYGDFGKVVALNGRVNDLYQVLDRARAIARQGDTEDSLTIYLDSLRMAPDKPLRLFVLTDGARSLRDAGRPDLALSLLNRRRDSSAEPGTLLLQRADCLLVEGRLEAARRAYLASRPSPEIGPWYSLQGFLTCELLGGASPRDLLAAVATYYAEFADYPAMRGWLLLPALLRGEAEGALRELARPPQEFLRRNPGAGRTQTILFPLAEDLWISLAEIDLGKPPSQWPDPESVEAQRDPQLTLQYRFLGAYRAWKAAATPENLSAFEKVYEDLRDASRRNAEAIIPFALCAYRYGFAARDAGRADSAREALRQGLRLAPKGTFAARAAQHIVRPQAKKV